MLKKKRMSVKIPDDIAALICTASFFVMDYTIVGKGVGFITYVFCILALLISVCKGKKLIIRRLKEKTLFTVMTISCISAQIGNYIIRNHNSTLITSAAVCIIIWGILLVLPDLIGFESFYKYFKLACILVSFVIIIQFILIYVFHQDISRIYLLPEKWAFASDESITHARPISIFPEPSFYGNFAGMMVLLSCYKKERYISIYFLFTAVLSTSLTGICICMFFIVFDWNSRRKKSIKNIDVRKWLVAAIFLTVLFFVYQCFASGGLDFARYGRSFYIRVISGYRAMKMFDWKDLLFGIGYGNMHFFVNPGVSNYLSGIFTIIINYGIINMLIFLMFCMDFFLRCKKMQYTRMAIAGILVLMIGQAMFYNTSFLIWIFIIYIVRKDESQIMNCQGVNL